LVSSHHHLYKPRNLTLKVTTLEVNKMKLVSFIVLFLTAFASNAKELCFSCAGSTVVMAVGDLSDIDRKSEETESICIDPSTRKITHLSAASTQIKGFRFVEKGEGNGFNSREYYYWESINTYPNWRYKENLNYYVEFSDLQYHLHVTQRESKDSPSRINYNGYCRSTERLNME
jgi:hypothetical protein